MGENYQNSVAEDMDEFGKVGVEMSHIQSQMHFDYDSAESVADSDLEDGESRKMLASLLYIQGREDDESSQTLFVFVLVCFAIISAVFMISCLRLFCFFVCFLRSSISISRSKVFGRLYVFFKQKIVFVSLCVTVVSVLSSNRFKFLGLFWLSFVFFCVALGCCRLLNVVFGCF